VKDTAAEPAPATGPPMPILADPSEESTTAENSLAHSPASEPFRAYTAQIWAMATGSQPKAVPETANPEAPVDEVAAMRERRIRAGTWNYPPPGAASNALD